MISGILLIVCPLKSYDISKLDRSSGGQFDAYELYANDTLKLMDFLRSRTYSLPLTLLESYEYGFDFS